mgnify:CR=1 FL=1
MRRSLFLLSMFVCICIQAQNVVFLKTGGTGNGASPSTPTGSLNTAYKTIEDAGGEGTIVIVDKFICTAAFARNVPKSENITITSKYGGIDYRDGNPNCILTINSGIRWTLYRPTTFENITFDAGAATTPYILFVANFHPVIMGEGIIVNGFPTTEIATGLSILGGSQNGQTGVPVTTDVDSHITIKSGKFIVIGFNRQITGTYTGRAYINISGGEIPAIYNGSVSGGVGGSLNLVISGGIFNGAIYACSENIARPRDSKASGDAFIKITGGNFSKCLGIFAGMDGISKVDLSEFQDLGMVKRRLYDCDTLITADKKIPYLTPNEVFDYGSFTDSKGQKIPYRIYYPTNFDESKKYPLVLFLHGNGSRGDDNETQLLSGGSAFISNLINSGNECIVLAPQCPSSSEWVSTYPGNAGYTVESIPMSSYLNASKELLDSIMLKTSVDKLRVYVSGASNGGGASWDLMCRFPTLFAAGIPMMGCGESSNAAAIGSLLKEIPIWTFHGDADGTLSVEGTRGIVAAIRNSGGTKIQYTEYPGVDHEIWLFSAHEGLIDWLFSQTRNNIVSSVNHLNLKTPKIFTEAGKINIIPEDSANIKIFNMSGSLLVNTVIKGKTSFAITSGTYIVKADQVITHVTVR